MKSTNLSLKRELVEPYGMVDGLSLQNLFYATDETFPGCFMFTHDCKSGNNFFKTQDMLDYLIKNTPEDEEFEYVQYLTYNITSKEEYLGFCCYLKKSKLMARVEKSISESYILFKNESADKVKELRDIMLKFYVEPEEEKNNIYTISSGQMGYSLIKTNVKVVADYDSTKQYNDDFLKEEQKIEKFINAEDKSGLVILHGEKGTGKTTFIRHLINKFSNRKFVFVPASLINILAEPSFASFLLSLNNHVIILEDCENAIRDRKVSGTASSVSLLLNMTDGLLSDDLGIKFICTFNEDVKNIDSALTRKGRLVSKYEFKPLSIEKSQKLLEEIVNSDEEEHVEVPEITKPMTLADIYNFEDDSYEEKRKSII